MATQTSLLTFEQFMDLPDQEGVRRELDEGALIEMPNPSFAHGTAISDLTGLLFVYREQSGLDFVISNNTGFRLAPDTVRAPDLCLVYAPRLQAMRVERGALVSAPDLAVEVVSPSESATDLHRKIGQYLHAGATAVWALYTDTRPVMAHRRNGDIRELTAPQSLQEPDLLPGLSIPVEKIFARAIAK